MKSLAVLRFRSAASIAATIWLTGTSALFAASAVSLPRSALPGVRSIDTIEHREMPRVDVEALLAEDAVRDSSGVPMPARYAKNLPVAFMPDSSGTWETLNDGSRLWRLRISSTGALSLSLGLKRFDLPAGAAFWVHAPDGSGVQGPYMKKNRNALGGLWTAVVLGDELVAELHVPARTEAGIEIIAVNHGYRFFGEHTLSKTSKQGSCNIDVICPEGNGWRDQIRSVARISVAGSGFLSLSTAQLVNNTSEDDSPYLLAAGHGVLNEDEAATLVTYWNYESPICGSLSGGTLTQNQSGASLLARWHEGDHDVIIDGSDFSLLELDQQPDPSFNVYYAGWDARDLIPDATTAIHHPNADEKSISFDHDPPIVTYRGGLVPDENGLFLTVIDWDEGTTEYGSSGGCLFDNATGRCVGTLSGGNAACGNDLDDWYGRFHSHWTGGGTPESRLSDWLDPRDTGILFLNGKNSGGLTGDETWLIPAVASLAGEPPSDWKSQLSVTNPSAETRSASIYFVARGQAWPGTLLSGPHAIAPNASLYIDDPLLPENPASGLMYVTVDGPGTAVFVRTYNLVPDGTTFGQGQPGIPLGDTASGTELVLPMVHSAPGVYRTNVGFAQTSTGTIQVKVEIFSAAGSLLAQKTYSQSNAWRQINDVFANMGIGNQTVGGGWIRVTLVSGAPSFWTTYATVIDDTTNDPTYILPVAP